jgi:hypothetical protein
VDCECIKIPNIAIKCDHPLKYLEITTRDEKTTWDGIKTYIDVRCDKCGYKVSYYDDGVRIEE